MIHCGSFQVSPLVENSGVVSSAVVLPCPLLAGVDDPVMQTSGSSVIRVGTTEMAGQFSWPDYLF